MISSPNSERLLGVRESPRLRLRESKDVWTPLRVRLTAYEEELAHLHQVCHINSREVSSSLQDVEKWQQEWEGHLAVLAQL